jgi:hypothetical protein
MRPSSSPSAVIQDLVLPISNGGQQMRHLEMILDTVQLAGQLEASPFAPTEQIPDPLRDPFGGTQVRGFLIVRIFLPDEEPDQFFRLTSSLSV